VRSEVLSNDASEGRGNERKAEESGQRGAGQGRRDEAEHRAYGNDRWPRRAGGRKGQDESLVRRNGCML
jgi:hypothetical protein